MPAICAPCVSVNSNEQLSASSQQASATFSTKERENETKRAAAQKQEPYYSDFAAGSRFYLALQIVCHDIALLPFCPFSRSLNEQEYGLNSSFKVNSYKVWHVGVHSLHTLLYNIYYL